MCAQVFSVQENFIQKHTSGVARTHSHVQPARAAFGRRALRVFPSTSTVAREKRVKLEEMEKRRRRKVRMANFGVISAARYRRRFLFDLSR
jgi:predicted RNase H-like nuclease